MTRVPCPACRCFNPADAFSCAECGRVLRQAGPQAPVVVHRHAPRYEPVREALRYLGFGLVIAPIFTFTPLLRYMGWFLGSLCHETGHTVISWLAGCPAFPAIRLDGHAAAVHQDQQVLLCVAVWVGIASFAWKYKSKALGAVALLYPLFAFTGLREFFFLAGGHLGELIFATIFFWRTLVGWSRSNAERVAYSACAWFLFGRNLWLCLGLLFSDTVRAWYDNSGSFGLRNDYLRLAHEVLGTGIGAVAFLMLLVTLAAPVAAWLLARRRRKSALYA